MRRPPTWRFRMMTPLLIASGLLAGSWARAGDRWKMTLAPDAAFAAYSGSDLRDSYLNAGLFLRADYLDRGGFTLGYHEDLLRLRSGLDDIRQHDLFVSGYLRTTMDVIHGSLIPALDLYVTSNDDPDGTMDTVHAVAPRISYLNLSRTLELGIGFTRSFYPDKLKVDQWTGTTGFGSERVWLRLRGFVISSSDRDRVQGLKSTAALEAKLTIWPKSHPAGIDSLQFGLLGGERLLAADEETGILYNLTDIERGGINAGIRFRLSRSIRLPVFIGYERFENKVIDDSYQSSYLYVGIVKTW